MRTEPVKYSADPFLKNREPVRVMVIEGDASFGAAGRASEPEQDVASFA